MADIVKSSINFDPSTFKENKEFLNWPGLQYLFYTKVKPMIKNTIGETKNIRDDENWYISYDVSTGQVYLVSADDNQVLYLDPDGSCGSIDETTGQLLLNVDRERSAMVNGFIDDRYGCIGIDGYISDEIGEATGRLYVNFKRGGRTKMFIEDSPDQSMLNRRVEKIENKLDSTIKIMTMIPDPSNNIEFNENP